MNNARLGNEFSVRFPRDRGELEQCFDLMQASSCRDTDLMKNEVVTVWENQLIDGVGDVMIMENPAYTARLQARGLPPFVCCLCGSFLTEAYARQLISQRPANFFGLGLIKQCIEFTKRNRGINPVATMDEIAASQAKQPDKGIRFATYMMILHPFVEEQIQTPGAPFLADMGMFAQCAREFTTKGFAGYNLHCWFSFIIGQYTMGNYVKNGQRLLWEHPNNADIAPDQRQYILCLTRDAGISRRLGAPEGELEVDAVEWWGHLFYSPPPLAGLTKLQKKMAYLLVMGFNKREIADRLFAPNGNINPYNNAMQCQLAIISHLRNAGYSVVDNEEETLRQVLIHNLQEVRPAIVPIYQKRP